MAAIRSGQQRLVALAAIMLIVAFSAKWLSQERVNSGAATIMGVARNATLVTTLSAQTYAMTAVGDGRRIWAWSTGDMGGIFVINATGQFENAGEPLLRNVVPTRVYAIGDGSHAVVVGFEGRRRACVYLIGTSPRDVTGNLAPPDSSVGNVTISTDGAWISVEQINLKPSRAIAIFISRTDRKARRMVVDTPIETFIPFTNRRALLVAAVPMPRDYGTNIPYAASSGYSWGIMGLANRVPSRWISHSFTPNTRGDKGVYVELDSPAASGKSKEIVWHETGTIGDAVSGRSRAFTVVLKGPAETPGEGSFVSAEDARGFWLTDEGFGATYLDLDAIDSAIKRRHSLRAHLYFPGQQLTVQSAGSTGTWVFGRQSWSGQPFRGVYVIKASPMSMPSTPVRIAALGNAQVHDIVPLDGGRALVELTSRGGQPHVLLATTSGKVQEVIPAPVLQSPPDESSLTSQTNVLHDRKRAHYLLQTPTGLFALDVTRVKIDRLAGSDDPPSIVAEDQDRAWVTTPDVLDPRRGVSLYDIAHSHFLNDTPLFHGELKVPTFVPFGRAGSGLATGLTIGTRLVRTTMTALPLTVQLGKTTLRFSAHSSAPSGVIRYNPNMSGALAYVRLDKPLPSGIDRAQVRLEIRWGTRANEKQVFETAELSQAGQNYGFLPQGLHEPIPLNFPVTITATLMDRLGSSVAWEWAGVRLVSPIEWYEDRRVWSAAGAGAVYILAALALFSQGLRRWGPLAVVTFGGLGEKSLAAGFKLMDEPIFFSVLVLLGLTLIGGVAIWPPLFRALEGSEPFGRFAPFLLQVPWVRRRLFAEYVDRVRAALTRGLIDARHEQYLPIPAAVVAASDTLYSEPRYIKAEYLRELLTGNDRCSVLLESPGGRGKSALLREVIRLLVALFEQDSRSPLPIVCAREGESLFVRAKVALGNAAFSDELLRAAMNSGCFVLVIDGLTESDVKPTEIERHNADFDILCPLLLSSRPDPLFRSALSGAGSWSVVEPAQLNDKQLARFIDNYGADPERFGPAVQQACRSTNGEYLPILVRLALMTPYVELTSFVDIYRSVVQTLLGSYDYATFDEAATLCFETYWKDGRRLLSFADEREPRKLLLAKLIKAGLVIPVDPNPLLPDVPKTVQFFHDSIQSYLTAVGVKHYIACKPAADRAAALERSVGYFGGSSDLVTDAGPELFQMCLRVLDEEVEIVALLRESLLNYATHFSGIFSRDAVVAAADGCLTCGIGPEVAGGAALQRIVQCCPQDLRIVGTLYARIVRQLWDIAPERSQDMSSV